MKKKVILLNEDQLLFFISINICEKYIINTINLMI